MMKIGVPLRLACAAASRTLSTSSTLGIPIKVGEALPSVMVAEDAPQKTLDIKELFAGKRGVLFAVPGAFTPACNDAHLPGYLRDFEALKSKGVEVVACVAVNDPFVMAAWGKTTEAAGKIRMLADACGEFTEAVGLGMDLKPLGGLRSKRYSMVIEDGVVKALNVEPDGTGLNCSLAEKINI